MNCFEIFKLLVPLVTNCLGVIVGGVITFRITRYSLKQQKINDKQQKKLIEVLNQMDACFKAQEDYLNIIGDLESNLENSKKQNGKIYKKKSVQTYKIEVRKKVGLKYNPSETNHLRKIFEIE